MEYAKKMATSIRHQLIAQTKKEQRTAMASRIRARRLNKDQIGIMMPQKAVWLDRMKPHYVSLKRGRLITRWARKNYDFGKTVKSGRSRVRTYHGGIKRGSQLYVTADPYVNKAMRKARNKFGSIMHRRINEII